MNWRKFILLICVLLLSSASGCGQVNPSQPTVTPIPGWEKFEGDAVELWLPESYEGGNTGEDIEIVLEIMRSIGPDYEQMAQMVEQNPSMFVLWALDSEVGNSGAMTNVMVVKERVLSALTVDAYLDATIEQFPAEFKMVERELVSLMDSQAGRMVTEFTILDVVGKQLSYFVKDGNSMWTISFTTARDEFDQRLPDFEQSMLTFAIRP